MPDELGQGEFVSEEERQAAESFEAPVIGQPGQVEQADKQKQIDQLLADLHALEQDYKSKKTWSNGERRTPEEKQMAHEYGDKASELSSKLEALGYITKTRQEVKDTFSMLNPRSS